MADIKFTYKDWKHKLNSYDDVISTFSWIANAIRVAVPQERRTKIECFVAFESGDLSYECNSIDEFKKYAFGKDITITAFTLCAYENEWFRTVTIISVCTQEKEFTEYVIRTEEEQIISDVREALREELREEFKSEGISNRFVIERYVDNSVNIGSGNNINNSVVGKNQKVEMESTKRGKSNVFWQIVIPIGVTVVGTMICFWLGIN